MSHNILFLCQNGPNRAPVIQVFLPASPCGFAQSFPFSKLTKIINTKRLRSFPGSSIDSGWVFFPPSLCHPSSENAQLFSSLNISFLLLRLLTNRFTRTSQVSCDLLWLCGRASSTEPFVDDIAASNKNCQKRKKKTSLFQRNGIYLGQQSNEGESTPPKCSGLGKQCRSHCGASPVLLC